MSLEKLPYGHEIWHDTRYNISFSALNMHMLVKRVDSFAKAWSGIEAHVHVSQKSHFDVIKHDFNPEREELFAPHGKEISFLYLKDFLNYECELYMKQSSP